MEDETEETKYREHYRLSRLYLKESLERVRKRVEQGETDITDTFDEEIDGIKVKGKTTIKIW